MDRRSELRDFLISRRAKITPERAGLTAYAANRRVPGLRREELAMLVGISVDYYVRLERGGVRTPSDSVLEGISRALQLDETEREHLFALARDTSAPTPRRRKPGRQEVREPVQLILDAMTGTPAYVRNHRLDILAANKLGEALFSPLFADARRPVNVARFVCLDPAAPGYYGDWEAMVDVVVAGLRAESGRSKDDKDLMALIGELTTHSREFSSRWAAHNVRTHRAGAKTLHHPVVGDLTISFEAMELTADPDLVFIAYTAQPGSPSADALSLLASWSATPEKKQTPQNTERGATT